MLNASKANTKMTYNFGEITWRTFPHLGSKSNLSYLAGIIKTKTPVKEKPLHCDFRISYFLKFLMH